MEEKTLEEKQQEFQEKFNGEIMDKLLADNKPKKNWGNGTIGIVVFLIIGVVYVNAVLINDLRLYQNMAINLINQNQCNPSQFSNFDVLSNNIYVNSLIPTNWASMNQTIYNQFYQSELHTCLTSPGRLHIN